MIQVNGCQINKANFPAGEQNINLSVDDTRYMVKWFYENDEEMVTLFYIVNHIKDHQPNAQLFLYMPYIPNARMDRVKSDCEVFTLKYFAKFINSLGFEKVYVTDAHSNVSLALIDRVSKSDEVIFRNVSNACENINTNDLVFYFPDKGAYDRYLEAFNNYYGYVIPKVYGKKLRNWKTHRIEGLDVVTDGVDLTGKTVVMVDDIISYGGSFYYSAQKLKELGVETIYACATHVENAMLDEEKGTLIHLLKDGTVSKVYTTHSIYNSNSPYVEVIENYL